MKTTGMRLHRQALRSVLAIIGLLFAASPLLAQVAAEPAASPTLWVSVWVEICTDGSLTLQVPEGAVAGDLANLLATAPSSSEDTEGDPGEACSRSLIMVEISDVSSELRCLDAAVWSKEFTGRTLNTSTP